MYDKTRWYNTPTTIDEAAELLMSDLSAKHQEVLSTLDGEEFNEFYESVATFVLNDFDLWSGNDALLRSCYRTNGTVDSATEPARIILNRVREMVQETSGIVIIT